MNINWYPGHMAKTKRMIKEKRDLIDVVLEVIDARIPLSSKIKDIDDLVKDKPRLLIMTKIDLCDMNETKKWITYYENMGYKVIGVNLIGNKNVNLILKECREILEILNNKYKHKGIKKTTLRALIIGIPNVGKSTLINRLVGQKKANVGNKPGVTKSLDWIRIGSFLELLDSPGILWPKFDDEKIALNLAAMTSIKEEVLPIDIVATYILTFLYKFYPKALKERYNIDYVDEEVIIDTLDKIGQKRGAIISGGEVDYQKVYRLIMKDLASGALGPVTLDRYKEDTNE